MGEAWIILLLALQPLIRVLENVCGFLLSNRRAADGSRDANPLAAFLDRLRARLELRALVSEVGCVVSEDSLGISSSCIRRLSLIILPMLMSPFS